MHRTSNMRLLKIRGGKANLFLLAREISRGLPLYKGFRERVNHPKVGDILRRLASQCREHVSIATSLDT